MSVRPRAHYFIADLVRVAEEEASAELFGILKRADEKFVTKRAYDNPRFVEDVVRDIVGTLEEDGRFDWASVEIENLESIHQHNAYASIEYRR